MIIAESFGRSGFARFINGSAGHLVRIVAGLALIGWGYTQPDRLSFPVPPLSPPCEPRSAPLSYALLQIQWLD